MLISRPSTSFKISEKARLPARQGFTLIEMIVIIGVLGALSSFLIGYGRKSGEQLLVVTNQAKLVSLISRAKSLSITTFIEGAGQPESPGSAKFCGYGVHIDQPAGTAFIFRDSAADCSSSDNIYKSTSGEKPLDGDLNSLKLDSTVVRFSSDSTLTDIVFIPPDPKIIINNDATATGREAKVGIEIVNDQSVKKIVKVTNAGNITTSAK